MQKEVVKFVLAIVLCAFFSASSQATNYYWSSPGAGSNAWNLTGNWDIANYPTTGDAALIYKAKECIIGTDMVGATKALAANVYVGGLASTNALLTIKGEAAFATSLNLGWVAVINSRGKLRIEPNAVVTVPKFVIGHIGTAAYSTVGDVNMMGGTLNVSTALHFGDATYGNGEMTMNGGTLNIGTGGNLLIASFATTSKGKLTVNSGAVINNIASNMYVGRAGSGELIINGSGKVKITSSATVFQVGSFAGSTGSMTMNGGILDTAGHVYIGTLSSNANFMQLNNDANVTAGSELRIALDGATSVGRLTIAGSAAQMKVAGAIVVGYASGTGSAKIELQAGTLTGLSTLTINSDGTINITGGTLILPIAQLSVVNGYIDAGRIYTGSGVADKRALKVATNTTQVIVTADSSQLKLAYNPVPANGSMVAPCADANIVFSWSPGNGAVSHDVYLGTTFNDVNDANTSTAGIYQGNQLLGDQTFDFNPIALGVGQTIYWRIDEVDSVTTNKGNVWSCTRQTLSDDFDYANTTALQAVWTNGILQIGSTAYLGTSPAGGRGDTDLQSMEIGYSTAGAPYESKVTQTFACPRDFTAESVKSLVLYFQPDKGNAPEVLFVELGDGDNVARVYYNSGDTQRITEDWAYWQFWAIKLSDFAGVNLANITSISIGAGDGSAGGGGIGKVYIDDIRVYPSACFGEIVAGMGDIVSDCSVDINDLSSFAMHWLESGSTVTAVTPSVSPVLQYTFDEGGGLVAADSSPGADGSKNGTVSSGTWGVTGKYNSALFHNGTVTVTLPAAAFSTITNEITISVWVRNVAGVGGVGTPVPNTAHFFDAGKGTGTYVFTTYIGWKYEIDNALSGSVPFITNYDTPGVQDGVTVLAVDPNKYYGMEPGGGNHWVHYAFVKDTVKGIQQIYVDGELVAEGRNMFRSIADITVAKLGTAAFHSRPFFGESDDLRLYDKALSQAEIISLAGKASVFQPLITNADINGDNSVNFADFATMASNWASTPLWP